MYNRYLDEQQHSEYIHNRNRLAERDQLAAMTRSQQPTLVQRCLGYVQNFWRHNHHLHTSSALPDHEAAIIATPKRLA